MPRLRRLLSHLPDPRTLSRSGILAVVALGLTIVVSALVSPQWPLDLARELFPDVVYGLAATLRIEVPTLVAIYGSLLTLVAVGLFWVSERRAREHGHRAPHLRERTVVGFLATISFVVGFVAARAVVVYGGLAGQSSGGRVGPVPWGELWVSGYHIHHFFYGFLLLVAAGAIALFFPDVSRRWVAVLYGLGLGIFVDEWGLLVTMDDYFARSSWFAAVTFLSLLFAGLIWTMGQAGEDRDEKPPPPPS